MSNASSNGSGKASPNLSRSRLNSLKHGLYATDDIFVASLNYHDKKTFEDIRNQIHTTYNPATSKESDMADRIAILKFRLFRIYALENNAVERSRKGVPTRESIIPHLERFSRYDWRLSGQLATLDDQLQRMIHSRITNLESDRIFPALAEKRKALEIQLEKQRLMQVHEIESLPEVAELAKTIFEKE